MIRKAGKPGISDLSIPLPAKCLISVALILFSLRSPLFMILSLAIICFLIVASSPVDALAYLFFLLAFAPVFKAGPSGQTFFNVAILAVIVRYVFAGHSIKIKPGLLSVLLVFLAYNVVIGGTGAAVELIKMFMYFALIYLVFKHEEKPRLQTMLLYFCLGLALASVAALLRETIPGLDAYLALRDFKMAPGEYVDRFAGLVSSPNYYTMDISIALASLVGLIIYQKHKLLPLIVVIVLSVFGFMSLSLSFLVTYGILLLITLIFLGRMGLRKLLLGVLIMAALILVIYALMDKEYLNTILFRADTNFSGEQSLSGITTGRSDIWLSYLQYFSDNLVKTVFGAGLGASLYEGTASHNAYIECVYFMGVIGFILYTVILSRFIPKKEAGRKRSLVNYVPLLLLLIRGFAINILFNDSFYFYFMIIAITIDTDFIKLKSAGAIDSAAADEAGLKKSQP
jgi:hypothetical protein